jgi:hypothetical protein
MKLQISVHDRPVIAFANVTQNENALGRCSSTRRLGAPSSVRRSRDREPHGVPISLQWRPVTAAGITKVAETLQNVLLRHFALVPGSRAAPAPSPTQRKPRRMRPRTVLQSCCRHEIWTGQAKPLRTKELLGLPIVISSRTSCEFRWPQMHECIAVVVIS